MKSDEWTSQHANHRRNNRNSKWGESRSVITRIARLHLLRNGDIALKIKASKSQNNEKLPRKLAYLRLCRRNRKLFQSHLPGIHERRYRHIASKQCRLAIKHFVGMAARLQQWCCGIRRPIKAVASEIITMPFARRVNNAVAHQWKDQGKWRSNQMIIMLNEK